MENLYLLQPSQNVLAEVPRKHPRYQVDNLLAVTSRGTGKILDISQDGFSMGCLYPHSFPVIMKIDLLSACGAFIKGLNVVKCWEKNHGPSGHADKFEITVGLAFAALDARTTRELQKLLNGAEDNTIKQGIHFAPEPS